MNETKAFLVGHGGNAGDAIWSIPSIHAILDKRGIASCTLLLKAGQAAGYPSTFKHPCGPYKMTRDFCESLIPLLKGQSRFEDVRVWDGEQLDLDLDAFRMSRFPFDRGDIGLYYSHVFPCKPRLWEPWLKVEAKPTNQVLVCRTNRYQNKGLSFKFLEAYPNVSFVGLPEEYAAFRKDQLCNIPHAKTKTFLDMAKKIAGCRLWISNQTAGYAIAEALKAPRLLEVFGAAPNVNPHGPNGQQIWTQDAFEATVKERLA